jgi:hypothetical protein
MPIDMNGSPPALGQLPESDEIASLLGELTGTRAAAPPPTPMVELSLSEFFAEVNWRKAEPAAEPPKDPGNLAAPASLTLRAFLTAFNWHNVPRDPEPSNFVNPLAAENVLAEFIWD